MLSELRKKDGAERISVTVGDMTETQVSHDAALVYLVFDTIGNLRTQQQQVACFRNASAHLKPGGRFLIENNVPNPTDYPLARLFGPTTFPRTISGSTSTPIV